MSSPTISMLAGLVKGYTDETSRQAKEALEGRLTQRDQQLQYLGHLASNPNVPTEHQQWALGKIQELLQADPTKKMPKVDLSELPPVTRTPPPQQAAENLPQMALQAPVAPGEGPSPTQPPTGAPGPSGVVGKAPGGTVNALGDTSGLTPPVGLLPGTPAAAPVTLPAQPQGVIQHPLPPEQIAPGGQLHLITPEERAQQALDVQQMAMQRLQRQFPDKSPEELAYFSQHGDFPKPQLREVPPGGTIIDEKGNVIFRSTEPKPGGKAGWEVKAGPGGEPVGMINRQTQQELSLAEATKIPEAKAALDDYQKGMTAHETKQEAKETRLAERERQRQTRQFAQQERMLQLRNQLLTSATKTMVEASPEVLKFITRIRQEMEPDKLGPAAGRWNEFWTGKIGTSDPKFTKLRTDVGLMRTLLMRMHVGARGGTQMLTHFTNLINEGKQSPDNMAAALDEIEAYARDLQETGAAHGLRTPAAPASGTAPPAGGFDWNVHPVVPQ